jgi:hypothetical protein
MPFFRPLNILFLHIPKTGGTSIEMYLCVKSKITVQTIELFSLEKRTIWENHSSQHATYQEIYEKQSELNIDVNQVHIWTVVRNPYERAISDLFFFGCIQFESSQEEVYEKMKEYIQNPSTMDNHKLPQHHFVIDSHGKLIPGLIILKNETLNEDMHKMGYTDFELNLNVTHRNEINYYDYMNSSFIYLINEYYSEDFELFGYEKIQQN